MSNQGRALGLAVLVGIAGSLIIIWISPDDSARASAAVALPVMPRGTRIDGIPPAVSPSRAPAPNLSTASPAPAPAGEGRRMTFNELSNFRYDLRDIPESATEDEFRLMVKGRIPESILKLDGERIAIKGYVFPIEMKGRRVRRLMISRWPPSCCYGRAPEINEYLDVRAKDPEGMTLPQHGVATIRGTLSVGEKFSATGGYIESIFQMEGESVEDDPER